MATTDPVLYARYAKRGVSGATAIELVTRFRVVPNVATRKSIGGTQIGTQTFQVGARGQVQVETESFEELVAHLAASGVEILAVGYKDGSGNTKMTPHVCAGGGGDSDFPPAEDGGDVPRFMLTFDIVADPADPEETLAESLAVAADT